MTFKTSKETLLDVGTASNKAVTALQNSVIVSEDPSLVKIPPKLVPSKPLKSSLVQFGNTPVSATAVGTTPSDITTTTTFNADKTLYVTNVTQSTNNQFFDITNNNISGGGVTSLNALTGVLNIVGGTGTTVTAGGSNVSINNVYEAIGSLSGATGVVTHNFATSSIFNHTSIAANFTVNVTNLGLSSGFATNVVLILNQGATPYIPNAFQIGGSAQSINWQGGSAPTGNANKKDLVSFSITNIGGTYAVFGQLVTFG